MTTIDFIRDSAMYYPCSYQKKTKAVLKMHFFQDVSVTGLFQNSVSGTFISWVNTVWKWKMPYVKGGTVSKEKKKIWKTASLFGSSPEVYGWKWAADRECFVCWGCIVVYSDVLSWRYRKTMFTIILVWAVRHLQATSVLQCILPPLVFSVADSSYLISKDWICFSYCGSHLVWCHFRGPGQIQVDAWVVAEGE